MTTASVSLRAIATQAGVSVASASRILRGRDECSAATRERVLAVARRLGYRPNLLVRGMQTGRTRTVGVMLYVAGDFERRIFVGIHDVLVAADHVPIVLWAEIKRLAADRSNELEQIHRLVDRRVDGVILLPRDDRVGEDYLHEIIERRIPLVTIDHDIVRVRADFVGTNDEAGARLAAEHLLGLGHRHLAHLAGPDAVMSGLLRRRSFESAVAAMPGATCVTEVDPTFCEGYETALSLLSRTPRPTALFCANDYTARSAYRAAAELGLAIPRDLSVVGFADLDLASFLSPPLTTLRQQPEEIGRRAAQILLDRIADPAAPAQPVKLRLPVDLVARASTARPQTGSGTRRSTQAHSR